jgi:hypothetical protein
MVPITDATVRKVIPHSVPNAASQYNTLQASKLNETPQSRRHPADLQSAAASLPTAHSLSPVQSVAQGHGKQRDQLLMSRQETSD